MTEIYIIQAFIRGVKTKSYHYKSKKEYDKYWKLRCKDTDWANQRPHSLKSSLKSYFADTTTPLKKIDEYP